MGIFKAKSSLISTSIAFIFLIVGGIEGQNLWFSWAALSLLIVFLALRYLDKGTLRLPSNFKLYTLFMFLFLLTIFWAKSPIISIKHFLNFLSGGLIWLLVYNFKKESLPKFDLLVYSTGLIFAIWFIYTKMVGRFDIESYNLVSYSVETLSHHHVGDLWAIVMGLALFEITKKKTNKSLLLIVCALGIYILITASSRSSYVALFAGVALFYDKDPLLNKLKSKLVYILLAIALVFAFLFATTQKGLLSHRAFYIQAFPGIYHNPLGVGIGNYNAISSDPKNHLFGISAYAGVADNIILEILTGMGIFGIPFVVWIYKIVKQVFEYKSKEGKIYKLIFIILTVNFMFNYVYFIPTLLWLWFYSMAKLSPEPKKSEF